MRMGSPGGMNMQGNKKTRRQAYSACLKLLSIKHMFLHEGQMMIEKHKYQLKCI